MAWEHGITNKNTLHQHVYGATRVQFGLGAQLACCARDTAADAVRASRQQRQATCPTFRADSSIRYDARTYRLMTRDQVSLNTVQGRVLTTGAGRFPTAVAGRSTWKIGGAELIRRHAVWQLCITQSKPAPDSDEPVGVIGVDLGMVNLATTDDGATYSGEPVDRVRARYHLRHRRLQAVGTKSAKRRLQQISGRERRFQQDVNHRISQGLVAKATDERKARALEELTSIRARATVPRSQRRRFSSWASGPLRVQVRIFVAYKAALAGVHMLVIDPRNTSRTCAACGYCDKHNRRSQSSFVCLACGHVAAADVNAARNTAYRAAVGYPLAGGPLAVQPLAGAASHRPLAGGC